eukprot:scaffold766_cov167-Ochromonas_danica.AAC.6
MKEKRTAQYVLGSECQIRMMSKGEEGQQTLHYSSGGQHRAVCKYTLPRNTTIMLFVATRVS